MSCQEMRLLGTLFSFSIACGFPLIASLTINRTILCLSIGHQRRSYYMNFGRKGVYVHIRFVFSVLSGFLFVYAISVVCCYRKYYCWYSIMYSQAFGDSLRPRK